MGKEENRDVKRWSDLKYIKHLLEVEKVGTSNYFKLFSGDKKTNAEEYWEQEKKYNKPRRVVGFAHYPDEKRISFLGEWKCFDNVIRYLPVGTSYIFRSEEALTKWKEKSLKNNYQIMLDTINEKIEKNQIFRRYFNQRIEESEVCPSCQKEMLSHNKDQALQCMRNFTQNQ